MIETVVENFFICPKCDDCLTSKEDTQTCSTCETKMENTGWFETLIDCD